MINVFRLHQKKLMLVITVLTILAFIWLYNPSDLKDLNANAAYTAYGKQLTQADVQRQAGRFYLARDLQQIDLIRELAGMAQTENQMLESFVWNLYVLQHEAEKLGIEPTDAQVADRIRQLPVFQTNGQFDYANYAKFVSEKLGPRGFTEVQLEGVIRDSLRLEALREVIGAPVAVGPSEIAEAGRLFRKVDLQTVTFPMEAAVAAVTVNEEELKGFFAQYQNSPFLIVPETRTVEFVEFALPAEEKADGNQVEVLQKLADQAVEFSNKAAAGDFAKAAAEAGLTVTKSPEFDRSGAKRSAGDASGPDLSPIAPSAFLLTEQAPVSEPIQSGDKFFVARLVAINPSRPMTFDEARAGIETQVRNMKAQEALRQNAEAAIAKIREALAGGTSFADAVAAAGLKAESIEGLEPAKAAADQESVVRATLLMEPGQLSGLIPTPQGGAVVYLVSRAPLDEAEFAKQKAEILPRLEEAKRDMVFQSWLVAARQAAKIGQVERRQ
jgi:hypothetical protein